MKLWVNITPADFGVGVEGQDQEKCMDNYVAYVMQKRKERTQIPPWALVSFMVLVVVWFIFSIIILGHYE